MLTKQFLDFYSKLSMPLKTFLEHRKLITGFYTPADFSSSNFSQKKTSEKSNYESLCLQVKRRVPKKQEKRKKIKD